MKIEKKSDPKGLHKNLALKKGVSRSNNGNEINKLILQINN